MDRRKVTNNIQKVKDKKKIKIDSNQSTLNITKKNDYVDELINNRLVDIGYKEPDIKTEEQEMEEKIQEEYHREDIIVQVDVDRIPIHPKEENKGICKANRNINREGIEVSEIFVDINVDEVIQTPEKSDIETQTNVAVTEREEIVTEVIDTPDLKVQKVVESIIIQEDSVLNMNHKGVGKNKMEKRRDILCQGEEPGIVDNNKDENNEKELIGKGIETGVVNKPDPTIEGVDGEDNNPEKVEDEDYDMGIDELEEELDKIMQSFSEEVSKENTTIGEPPMEDIDTVEPPIEDTTMEEQDNFNDYTIEGPVGSKQAPEHDVFNEVEITENKEIQNDEGSNHIIDDKFLDELEKDLSEYEFGDLPEYSEEDKVEDIKNTKEANITEDDIDFMDDLINEIKEEQDKVATGISFVAVEEEEIEEVEEKVPEVKIEVKPIINQTVRLKSKKDMTPEELMEALMIEAESDLPQEIDVDTYAEQIRVTLERLRQIPMETKSREVLEKRIIDSDSADLDDIDKIIDILETNPDMREILDGDDYMGL